MREGVQRYDCVVTRTAFFHFFTLLDGLSYSSGWLTLLYRDKAKLGNLCVVDFDTDNFGLVDFCLLSKKLDHLARLKVPQGDSARLVPRNQMSVTLSRHIDACHCVIQQAFVLEHAQLQVHHSTHVKNTYLTSSITHEHILVVACHACDLLSLRKLRHP